MSTKTRLLSCGKSSSSSRIYLVTSRPQSFRPRLAGQLRGVATGSHNMHFTMEKRLSPFSRLCFSASPVLPPFGSRLLPGAPVIRHHRRALPPNRRCQHSVLFCDRKCELVQKPHFRVDIEGHWLPSMISRASSVTAVSCQGCHPGDKQCQFSDGDKYLGHGQAKSGRYTGI